MTEAPAGPGVVLVPGPLERARARAAQRRQRWQEAEAELARLEAAAERSARRERQQQEIARLEARIAELETGPIRALKDQQREAVRAIREAERRAERIARSLEHQRQTATMVEDRLRRARSDGDVGELAKLTARRSELEQVIQELEAAITEARREADGPRMTMQQVEEQLAPFWEGSPVYELQRLQSRIRWLRECDGEDEDVVRQEQERSAAQAAEARLAEQVAREARLRAEVQEDETAARVAAWRMGQAYIPGARR